MKTFREIVDEVMKRSPPMERISPADLPYVMADCMKAIADEMDRRYPVPPAGGPLPYGYTAYEVR